MAIADIGAYAHLSDVDIESLGRELDAIRSDIEESLGERDAAYIRRTIRFQRTLDVARAPDHRLYPVEGGLAAGDRFAGLRQERREHGNRPQRGPWSMGLDERPGDPFEHLGMGHGRRLVAVEVLAQLPPPRVQQRRRHGRRPRLRRHAGHPRPAVETAHLLQPLRNLLLASIFEWGIGLHGVHSERDRLAPDEERSPRHGRSSERSPGRRSRTTCSSRR